ncbi:MAG: hypothetical protein J07HQX50_00634 [Haloquadratum sp. J07HQX50]|nr:MAG: hypothetical protein J07HQX50_00634 [Haloquadratum sp. J07HQX50]
MDTALIREYVMSAQSDIQQSPQMGEATTKASILNDFIELLGWEIPANTELEYSVKAFASTYKVDYALVLDGRPVAFLEAKGLDTPLNSTFREKFEDYLRGENVNWGILTNGQEYEFYQRRVVNSQVSVEMIEQTTLDQLPNKDKILEAYQPATIRDEESEVIVQHIRELREAWHTLSDDKDELAAAVVDTLTDSVSDAIEPDAESQAKEMIDRLITDIESEIDTNTDIPRQLDDEDSSTDFEDKTTQLYSGEISQSGDVVKTFADSVQGDLMTSVVNYFIQNHNLISAIEPLPYIPGRERAIINDEPTYNDREMKQARELEQGYYIELNLSWDQKQRELERMAEACGVEVSATKNDDS